MPSTRRVLEHVAVAHTATDAKRSKANVEIIVASKVTTSTEDLRSTRSNPGDVIVPPKETLRADVKEIKQLRLLLNNQSKENK